MSIKICDTGMQVSVYCSMVTVGTLFNYSTCDILSRNFCLSVYMANFSVIFFTIFLFLAISFNRKNYTKSNNNNTVNLI